MRWMFLILAICAGGCQITNHATVKASVYYERRLDKDTVIGTKADLFSIQTAKDGP